MSISVDWKEMVIEYVIKVDVLGLSKNEIKVEVDDIQCVLCINGEWCKEEEWQMDEWYVLECGDVCYLCQFVFFENVNFD